MSASKHQPTAGSAPLISRTILLAGLLALAAPALAAPLPLTDAMRLAAGEAPMLAAEAARSQAAREDAVRADALPDPMLMVGVNNLPITGGDAFRLGADMMTMRQIGVTQEWPSRSKRAARRAAAEATVDERVASEAATRLAVQRETALAWLQRWRAETELVLLDEIRSETARGAELIETRLAAGRGGAADALAARAELVALDQRRVAIRTDIATATAELARWLGEQASRPLAAEPAFDQLPLPAAELRAQLAGHAELQLAARRSDQAERAVDVARANTRPDLRFGASYGARSGGASDMLMLEVGVGLPLFRANRQDRDIAARRAESDAAQAEYDDLHRRQRAALERELANWHGLLEQQARLREQRMPLARDRVALALTGYRSGEPLQPWIEAHHEQMATYFDYARIRAELGASWVRLATLLPETAQ
jgi:outer membrane protein, heavy metal efflux system